MSEKTYIMATRVRIKILGVICVTCGLTGCGGGGDDSSSSSSSSVASSSLSSSSSSVSSSSASSTSSSVSSSSSSSSLSSSSSSLSSSSASSTSSISLSVRSAAATQTAQGNAFCTAVQPFYWEVGDGSGALVSGSVGGTTYQANTVMLIASASKWIFGAYVAQLRNGQVTNNDVTALTMRAGYTNFSEVNCFKLTQIQQDAETVSQCQQEVNAFGTNGDHDSAADGHFSYNGGHFQKLAVDLGIGNANNAGLRTVMQNQLGSDFDLTYAAPQLAGGVSTTAANYALFLRKIVNNQLFIHDLLGSNSICTNLNAPFNATNCPLPSQYTPMPSSESWHYSLGHWVEDDPSVGDGAYSSAGAFGFYPWIDVSKTWYGVLARKAAAGSGHDSAACGRLIRKAWVTGVAQ